MSVIRNFVETIKEFNKEFVIQTRYAFSVPKKNYHSIEPFTKNSQQQFKIVTNSDNNLFFENIHNRINLICDTVSEKKECYREINEIFSN